MEIVLVTNLLRLRGDIYISGTSTQIFSTVVLFAIRVSEAAVLKRQFIIFPRIAINECLSSKILRGSTKLICFSKTLALNGVAHRSATSPATRNLLSNKRLSEDRVKRFPIG